MSSPTMQTPMTYLDAVTATTQGKPIALGYAGNGISFHNVWNIDTSSSQTLTGTLLIEASNDPALISIAKSSTLTAAEVITAIDAANWVDVTAVSSPTDPTTGAGDAMEVLNNTRFWWVRMKITVAGTGDFTSFVATHGDG